LKRALVTYLAEYLALTSAAQMVGSWVRTSAAQMVPRFQKMAWKREKERLKLTALDSAYLLVQEIPKETNLVQTMAWRILMELYLAGKTAV
jgi:SpoU rRNA methylase family enzyme